MGRDLIAAVKAGALYESRGEIIEQVDQQSEGFRWGFRTLSGGTVTVMTHLKIPATQSG